MEVKFGDYTIKTHQLDNKLSVQIFSGLGEVYLNQDDNRISDFPNEICFYIKDSKKKPKAKGLKRFKFGEYSFILGTNYDGELLLFHSGKLTVGKKVIGGKDTLTLARFKAPKSALRDSD
jgi:hypothetical protein